MSNERPVKTYIVKRKVNDEVLNTKLNKDRNVNVMKSAAKAIGMVQKSFSRSPTTTQNSFYKKEKSPTGDGKELESQTFEDPTFAEFAGPQLKMNKNHLAFIEKVGNLSRDSIKVTNNGSTAIYYRWKKLDKQAYFESAIFDKEERFFCHAVCTFNDLN